MTRAKELVNMLRVRWRKLEGIYQYVPPLGKDKTPNPVMVHQVNGGDLDAESIMNSCTIKASEATGVAGGGNYARTHALDETDDVPDEAKEVHIYGATKNRPRQDFDATLTGLEFQDKVVFEEAFYVFKNGRMEFKQKGKEKVSLDKNSSLVEQLRKAGIEI